MKLRGVILGCLYLMICASVFGQHVVQYRSIDGIELGMTLEEAVAIGGPLDSNDNFASGLSIRLEDNRVVELRLPELASFVFLDESNEFIETLRFDSSTTPDQLIEKLENIADLHRYSSTKKDWHRVYDSLYPDMHFDYFLEEYDPTGGGDGRSNKNHRQYYLDSNISQMHLHSWDNAGGVGITWVSIFLN